MQSNIQRTIAASRLSTVRSGHLKARLLTLAALGLGYTTAPSAYYGVNRASRRVGPDWFCNVAAKMAFSNGQKLAS